MERKFNEWYTDQVTLALDQGVELTSIEVPLKLSNVKPLHAKWLLGMYNHMTSDEGKNVCIKGWEVSGIKDAVEKGSSKLPSLDPFEDLDPMLNNESIESEMATTDSINSNRVLEAAKYVSGCYDDDDSDCDCEWIEEDAKESEDDDYFDDEEDDDEEDDKED